MELFSHRQGIKPIKNIMQVESMDDDLRNTLWNNLCIHYWDNVQRHYISEFSIYYPSIEVLLKRIWHNYYKKPIDTMNNVWSGTYNEIRDYFFSCKWNEVYDFIEFVANSYPSNRDDPANIKFMNSCNFVLQEEVAAYRFVGGRITQITSETEIAEIEKALSVPDSLKPIKIHLKTALDLLADRTSPDYRNSIKESISAVESLCKIIAKNDKAPLTLAIETIEKGKKIKMHRALGRAFIELYSYTNAAEGIRHGLSDEPNLDLEDARFMLVSCSAFINYLIVKSSKAGINL